MMDDEKLHQVALSFVPGIGDVNTKQLISYCGSASAIFKSHRQKLRNIPGIGMKTITSLGNREIFEKAEKLIKKCANERIQILFYTDPDYPKRLKQILDAPPLIYFKGKTDLNNQKIVAIVGTRQATEYGKFVTGKIIEQLKPHKVLIVSGLAYGIDIHAHKMAIQHDLPTLGVMASGLNIVYPAIHKNIVYEMMSNGGVLSEYPLDEAPEAHRFPARNRIIAGIADATIIVEAAERGGALITAEIANSYNKDVFAIPGDINNKYSAGCNNLIKSHKANLLTSVKDIEYIMNWEVNIDQDDLHKELTPEDFADEEWKIIDVLKGSNSDLLLDDLSWKSQIPVNKLASFLLNLEFKGTIKSLPGKRYKLN